MKRTIFTVAVLLLSYSSAKLNPAERSLTCSGFPKQLSGRLYTVEISDSGSVVSIDMPFNLDRNLQRFHEEDKSDDMGPSDVIMDFKEGKVYVIHAGGCFIEPLEPDEQIPGPDLLKGLPLLASGSAGLNGTKVDLHSLHLDGSVGIVTLQSGDQCIPVSFATKQKESCTTASFLDLKTTVDPNKLKIPDNCKQIGSRRSMKEGMAQLKKRSVPILEALAAFQDEDYH